MAAHTCAVDFDPHIWVTLLGLTPLAAPYAPCQYRTSCRAGVGRWRSVSTGQHVGRCRQTA
eukprot:2317581-Rhodomonas_salina.2